MSLDQCAARFSAYGWIRNELKRDHGEDVLIQIYADGDSTGLSFLLQAKSTTSLASLVQKRDPNTISYPLEVAALEHWSASAAPVVVVLWDVKQQEGVWVLISEVIAELEARRPGWRRSRSVTVYVPVNNKTDDSGLARLRHAVADHYLPIFRQQHKSFVFMPTFSFPQTGDGQNALAAFHAFLDSGEAVRLDGKFVEHIKMPDWWERLYGPNTEVKSFVIGPAKTETSVACRVEVETTRFPQPVAISYVDLKVVQGGQKEVSLSNEHQQIPVHIRIRLRRPEGTGGATWNFSFAVNQAPANIYDARDAAAFALAIHSAKRIRVVERSTGKAMLDDPFPDLKHAAQLMKALEWWYDLLEKLCFVQSRIARFGTVTFTDGWLQGKDEAAIRRLYEICATGEERATLSTFRITLKPAQIPRNDLVEGITGLERDPSDEKYCIKFTPPARKSIRIVSLKVPLGRVEMIILDSIPMLRQLLEAVDSGKDIVEVNCKRVRVVQRYPDWLPGGAVHARSQVKVPGS